MRKKELSELKKDRALTAKLATENNLMPFIKAMAQRFGNNGKLPMVAVRTRTQAAWFSG